MTQAYGRLWPKLWPKIIRRRLLERELGSDLDLWSALGRTRTCNLLIRSQVLYPLSYERTGRATAPTETGYPPRRVGANPIEVDTGTRVHRMVKS